MIITRATDWQEVQTFYHSLIDAIQNAKYHPMWQKEIYPSTDDLKSAAEAGTLFVGRIESGDIRAAEMTAVDEKADGSAERKDECVGTIAAAMSVNQHCNDEYKDVHWRQDLDQSEFMVIHMLGVHPKFGGQGFAKEMVRFALDYAKRAGMKAVRLDVMEGNLPAEKLYPAVGFEMAERIQMYYEDTGWREFELYEYNF